MKKFFQFYKWELKNELYGCIYFAAMLSMYCILVLIHGGRNVDIFIMLQMLLVCYGISTFQMIIFSDENKYSKKELFIKLGLWFICSMILIIIISIIFNWFDSMETWAIGSFLIYMIICFIGIWVGIYITNKLDSKNLNQMLSNYQNKDSN
ncbi:DUF3021 family protein [Alkalibaculum sp. M08DMB]|uniref:DUF3021 family protein n=1 Tax=Alkalibaculum sporogenes TaxID=2655001 RepID=A0A6A7K7V2_9FIRM|nr:DUF3021 family protein [Alkalibaculum sporogenes]MPW25500.1 DUF3021 family protein [Alkalibaculum sporogenes]